MRAKSMDTTPTLASLLALALALLAASSLIVVALIGGRTGLIGDDRDEVTPREPTGPAAAAPLTLPPPPGGAPEGETETSPLAAVIVPPAVEPASGPPQITPEEPSVPGPDEAPPAEAPQRERRETDGWRGRIAQLPPRSDPPRAEPAVRAQPARPAYHGHGETVPARPAKPARPARPSPRAERHQKHGREHPAEKRKHGRGKKGAHGKKHGHGKKGREHGGRGQPHLARGRAHGERTQPQAHRASERKGPPRSKPSNGARGKSRSRKR